MTCMEKDYKFKIKMVQEQWLQLKMKSFWGSNMNESLMRGNKNFWLIGRLPFSASGGDRRVPPVRKTLIFRLLN